jgi:acyl-coenzyme A thioesterase PaaI-like protein
MQTIDNQPSTPSHPQPQSICIVCGPDHPHGLRLKFDLASDGSVGAHWTPAEDWQGFRGIIHGGIIGMVLDEAMAKAVAAVGIALTGELRVRFRHPVAPGEDLRIRGWIVERTRRVIKAEATLTTVDGCERAHAWSAFLPPNRKEEGLAG